MFGLNSLELSLQNSSYPKCQRSEFHRVVLKHFSKLLDRESKKCIDACIVLSGTLMNQI